jgi:hypothetical protein
LGVSVKQYSIPVTGVADINLSAGVSWYLSNSEGGDDCLFGEGADTVIVDFILEPLKVRR